MVYASPSLTTKVVEINDGAEIICCDAFSVTQLFPGGPGGADGRLIIFTSADDSADSGELIALNRIVVGGPIDGNLGHWASLFDIPVHFRPRHDSATIYTPADLFGWHLAVQVVGRS